MEELRLGLAPLARGQTEMGAWLKSWQLGQLLRAQVVNTAQAGGVTLRIANHQVSAATDLFLQKGAWLDLQVTGLLPAPKVRILDAVARSVEPQNPLERQAQILLPRQGDVLRPLLTLLDSAQRVNLLSLLGSRGGVVDVDFDSLVLPGPPRSARALRRAMLHSGLYFEAALGRHAADSPPPQTDLKALLFRLLAGVTAARAEQQAAGGANAALTLLSTFQAELEGALATITLNQLSASAQRAQDGWLCVFHVPFRMQDHLHGVSITLRREARATPAEPEREWQALVVLDLPQLGALEVDVFLRGNRVSAVFYCQRDHAIHGMEAGMAGLTGALQGHGFEVGVLRVHRGSRESSGDDLPWRAGLYHSV